MSNIAKQELFNKAYVGVVTQGRKSINGDKCAYRGPNGDKCAFGHILADVPSALAQATEGLSASRTIRDFIWSDDATVQALGLELEPHQMFCDDLQIAHDRAENGKEFVDSYKRRIADLANEEGLTVPELPSTENAA